MSNGKMLKLLKDFMAGLRTSSVRQKDLASRLGVTNSYVSQVESGATIPKDEKLVEFARVLGAEDRLPEFLLRAAHDRVSSDANGEAARRAYRSLLKQLGSKASPSKPPVPRRTLEHFPRAFEPLVAVTGDRREDPPKTCGDVGALSASPLDDRYLSQISFSSRIDKISDKVFMLADRKYLASRFGKTNLLVIGSPAGNHLARIINRHALFRFAFDPRTSHEIDQIIRKGERAMLEGGASALKVFRDGKMADLKFIMSEFKQGGIMDPLVEPHRVRARSLRDGVDFGTITIAKHPYAENDDVVAIMAAGFHLPGTVHAVRLLSDADFFTGHPLGGVVEIKMDEENWYERIEKADAHWDTEEYELADMLVALEKLASHENGALEEDEAATLNTLTALVRAIQREPERHPEPSGQT